MTVRLECLGAGAAATAAGGARRHPTELTHSDVVWLCSNAERKGDDFFFVIVHLQEIGHNRFLKGLSLITINFV